MQMKPYQTHAFAIRAAGQHLGYADNQALAVSVAHRITAHMIREGKRTPDVEVIGVRDAFNVPPFGLSVLCYRDNVQRLMDGGHVGPPLTFEEASALLSEERPAGARVPTGQLATGDVIALYDDPAQPVTVESVFPCENPRLPGYMVVKVTGRAPNLEDAFLFSEGAMALRLTPARQAGRRAAKPIRLRVTPEEHATILAALRLRQHGMGHQYGGQIRRTITTADLDDIASCGGALEPLNSDQIDSLCERLNAS